jgi:DNA-binding beta-propeller fold protein YncE
MGLSEQSAEAQRPAAGVPSFQVDPFWPKFDGNWIFGSIGGVAIDPTNDHVFVLQRPSRVERDEDYAAQKPPVADCCVPAPPVMEFDPNGKLVRGWGPSGTEYEWPTSEHGISIDYRGNVWIAGNGKQDAQVLKFTKAGKFLGQIGRAGKSTGNLDVANFNQPTKAAVYQKTNEVFVTDGYGNRRVIVFDADTGKFKRLWGAYGNKPDDAAPRARLYEGPASQQFNIPHDVLISNDDLVYVADRSNNRIQVFRPDGTFVKEAFIAREVRTPTGTAGNIACSPDPRQQFLYVTGGDQRVRILDRNTLQVVGSVGRLGHYAGQFHHITDIAVDSKGNLYVGENEGKRVQKFIFKGTN